jgi:hypothetical protein
MRSRKAAPEVRLRDRDDETEVCLRHLALGLHVAALDALREIHLLVRGQELHLPDLSEIEPEGVERRLDREIELRHSLLVFGERGGLVRRMLVLLALHELDAVVDEVRVEVLDLLLRELDFLEALDDLVVREEALLDSLGYELVQLLDVRKRDIYGEHGTSAFTLAGRG